jgi:CheY-like chemotaxis protein
MPLKILIAEDYQDLADSYRSVLEGRGHEVTITTNGMECKNVFRPSIHKQMDGTIKSYFDIVILDQKMPFMDGVETAKELQFLNPNQKIVFITGYAESVLQKIPQLSRNVLVMKKPFTVQELLLAVENFSVDLIREMTKNIRQ